MACGHSRTQALPAKVPELSSIRGCQAGLAKPRTLQARYLVTPTSLALHRRCFRTASPASHGMEETLDWIVRILESGQTTDMRPQVPSIRVRSPPGSPEL